MILKARRDLAPALRDRLLELHPYELPAMVALNTDPKASHAPFLAWVAEQ